MRELSADGPIVFYDGDCGLCDRFVKFLIKIDKKRRLRYSTLQGETAKQIIGSPEGASETWSIQLLDSEGLFQRSQGALRTIAHVGGIWRAARWLMIFPRPIRDGVYRFVATHRYRWFGKTDSCMLPTPALRERFLP